MTVVPGGEKCNLVTGYQEGEDTNLDYGRHHWLAQTFTIDAEHVLFRFLVKSWAIIWDLFYHYALRATDAQGKPIGEDICHTTLSPSGQYAYSPGKWRRFDFMTFPKLPAGTYAIILSVPDSPSTGGYKARSDSTEPTYAPGKAWKSTDSGDTWEEIPTTDLMFQVWGWEPPPDPPPTPAISNWAPLAMTSELEETGYKIVVTTDIPVHLFMRWTTTKPLTHPTELYRRGISLPSATRWCFVAWEENEQIEPGDTYIHTFLKYNWPVCQTRWFYFIGTKQAEESPSASPIFSKHRFELPPPVITSDYADEATINYGFCQYWNAQCQTFTPDHDYTAKRISLMLNQFEIERKGPYVVKLTKVNGLPWDEEVLWAEVRQSEELPLPGVAEWVHFDDVNIPLQAGVTYRIIVHTLLGWSYWNGSEWVEWEAGAGMMWWCSAATDPYPRGYAYYGANFWWESGSWTIMPSQDRTFLVWE